LEANPDRPYLLEFEWRFLAYELSLVPGLTSGNCNVGVHDRLLLGWSLQFAVPSVMPETVANSGNRANSGRSMTEQARQ
jgi:hypothetical protein